MVTSTVLIDTREIGASYIDYLREAGKVEVNFKQLTAGDILVNGLAIERKTVEDFFLTLREGRLFAQLLKLKQTYDRQLLLIEGKGMRYHLDQEPFFGLYIRLAAGWQLPVLHTQNEQQTAMCIARICTQDAVAPAGPIRPRPRNPAYKIPSVTMRLLLQIPGIGPTHVKALLEEFGTLERIFAADENALKKVRGIGKIRARTIKVANGLG